MEFKDTLSIQLIKLRTIYDLAAFCYDYLAENVGNQEVFVGKYIMRNENADIVNPNLKKLERFSRWTEQILRKRADHGLPFAECMSQIQVRLQNLVLKEYGEPLLNNATIRSSSARLPPKITGPVPYCVIVVKQYEAKTYLKQI